MTGELPPGAKIGASFVHDPKLTSSTEVKAKVALKVKDVNNCPMIAARNLVAAQRGVVMSQFYLLLVQLRPRHLA